MLTKQGRGWTREELEDESPDFSQEVSGTMLPMN